MDGIWNTLAGLRYSTAKTRLQGIKMNMQVTETRRLLLFVNDKLRIDQERFKKLANGGTAIICAASTDKAMALFGRVRFDAVLTDLHRLENGFDNGNAGIELTLKIRQLNKAIPIFIYTKNLKPGVSQLAATAGATLITESPTELDHAMHAHLLL
jgi:CheY-like chemotaxis protein